ncbi:MAG: small-conductance mechanosensitive channel [Sphingobacteriales bacterium]|jgi:small-conductance mechanosensitive channel
MNIIYSILLLASLAGIWFLAKKLKKNRLMSGFPLTVLKWGGSLAALIIFVVPILGSIPATSEIVGNTVVILKSNYTDFVNYIDITILNFGDKKLTLVDIIKVGFLFWLILMLSKLFRRFLDNVILPRTKLELGVQHAVASISSYIVAVIGIVIIFQTTGLDLSAFAFLAGAVGVGLGFGLQNIANNFISGLIILLERPIKVGDRIEVDGIDGNVDKISARATTVVTNDNIAIIIPNSEFISKSVINWSYTDRKVRFRIPIGVSYSSDVTLVKKLLLEVAEDNANVLSKPNPDVYFIEFGDSSLNFQLIVWTSKMMETRPRFYSEINFEVWKKFNENGIQIPFPQRDLHIKSGLDSLSNMKSSSKSE